MLPKCWSLCCCLVLQGSLLFAGGTAASTASDVSVSAALGRELAAVDASLDRRMELQEARSDEQNAAAWWQSGYVNTPQGWRSWDESPVADPQRVREYQQRRDDAGADAGSQLKLADWCERTGLKDQERVHLMQALRTGKAENPRQILKRLGYRQIGSSWFTEAELAAATRQFAAQWKAWKRINPQLDKLAAQLVGKPRLREKALVELCRLANRDTALIVEQSLAGRGDVVAKAVVQALSGVKSYQASQSLARIAVGTPWEPVRASAIAELRQRSWDEFVPIVLDMMHEPLKLSVEAEIFPVRIPGSTGQLEWRFVWSREGRHSVDVAITQLMYRGNARRFVQSLSGSSPDVDLQAISRADQMAMGDLIYQALSNTERFEDSSRQLNQQAAYVLSRVTDQPLDGEPSAWWNWWDRAVADSPATEPKTTNVVSVDVQTFGTATPRCECLVAGTPVWTEEGFRPIERIRIGDRVLSKNIETGELKYQPVLHTSRRTGAAVANVKIGEETISASLGHQFWVSGRGWTRTHQMQDGMAAHTPTGTVPIEVAKETRTADVYNLVVDDFHAYFVGKSMILGHDVVTPAPTDIRVPGLEPDLTASK